jgi:hypothetical protein
MFKGTRSDEMWIISSIRFRHTLKNIQIAWVGFTDDYFTIRKRI